MDSWIENLIERGLYRLLIGKGSLILHGGPVPLKKKIYLAWRYRPFSSGSLRFKAWKALHPIPEWTMNVLSDVLLRDKPDTYAPHCDQLILHRPGECEYCDMYPKSQAYRVEKDIPFAGEQGCPESLYRPMETAYHWGGNRKSRRKEVV